MRYLLLLLPLLFATVLPAQAQSHIAHVAQVDTSAYPTVTVYVRVTDASGTPISGLTARDFTLTEDQQPVTITSFAGGGAESISTVLVIDRSGSMADNDKLSGAKRAAQAFVEQMRPGDRTALIAFSDEPELIQGFTNDTAVLERAIRRIRADGSTALYDSMIAGIHQLENQQGRKALLLLTDGRDMISTQDPSPASRATIEEAIEFANFKGIAVQVIGLGERGTRDTFRGIDERVLERIAKETGGEYFYTPRASELATLYQQLSQGMHEEYVISYQSPRPYYDGTRRDIQVSVGGVSAGGGSYVERHMINVQSSPIVGLALLVPVLGLLLLPGVMARRSARSGARQPAPVAPVAATVIEVAQCRSCQAPLSSPDASFCTECGASQRPSEGSTILSTPQPERRRFCDQCGQPLRPTARFCASCGTAAPSVQLEAHS